MEHSSIFLTFWKDKRRYKEGNRKQQQNHYDELQCLKRPTSLIEPKLQILQRLVSRGPNLDLTIILFYLETIDQFVLVKYWKYQMIDH